MKTLIIAMLIALPTTVHAQTLVKLWAVGSIIVMEYVEDNGDRTVYAYSKEDNNHVRVDAEDDNWSQSRDRYYEWTQDDEYMKFREGIRTLADVVYESPTR